MPVFLYTDIEGSTHLWETHGPSMGAILDRHDEILMDCIAAFSGRHVKNTGDGMMVIFQDNEALPLECALSMQRRLAAEKWPDIEELRVRMAIHAGPAEYRAGDYFGNVVNRLARLLDTAWGGQIILTPDVVRSEPIPDGATLTDLGVHLLKDLSEPQQIYELHHPDLFHQGFPPLRSMSSQPNNLPSQLTPLVGRAEELVEIDKLLSMPDCRLLTLVAPGGMGKTRLGLQAAAEQIETFPHGVYFVPLAGVVSAEQIPSTIATALKLSFYGSEDIESQLLNYLGEKQLLLLLDNFEHLVDGASFVTRILAKAPGVKVLVTSRRHLRLQVEWSYEVRGLSVPGDSYPGMALSYDSVELFVQSARRISPTFDPSQEDQQAIIRVCKLVEGMPLALELAAAWVRALTCQEIADEIERDLDMLATEMQDIPLRQRSVRAIFEHSWNELSPAEQAAFAKLSLFRGGFEKIAAQKVTGATILILSELIDGSLISRDSSGRFQVHELLRQYASAKLDSDESTLQTTQERHAKYYTGWLKELEEDFIRGSRTEPIASVTQELDNVLLAWHWAIDHQNVAMVVKGMSSLFWYYESKALYSDGETLFRSAADACTSARLLNQPVSDPVHLTLINIQARSAWFTTRMSRFKDVLKIGNIKAEEASELLLADGDLEGHWLASGIVVNALYGMGDYEAARRYLEHHDERLDQQHQYSQTWPWAKGHNLANLGRIAGALGDYNAARRLLQAGVDILRPLHDHVGVMLYIHTLGGIVQKLGDVQRARDFFQEGLGLAENHAYPMGKILALGNLGNLAYAEGDYQVAREHFQASLNLSVEIGDSRGRALALTNLGRVATGLGHYEEARTLFEQGLDITERTGNRRGAALTMNWLSTVHLLMGDLALAHELCEKSWEICKDIGYQKGSIQALLACGEVALGQDDYQEARLLFNKSLVASQRVGYVAGVLRSRVGLGRTLLQMGELEEAADELREGLASSGEGTNKRVDLVGLRTLADTMIRRGRVDEGTALLTMVSNHRATDHFTRRQALDQLDSLKDEIDHSQYDRAVASGKSLTLEDASKLFVTNR